VSSKQIRPVALYLPQFHPIPENDEWWGKGFTEWTNVVKAKPLFRGHYQPHLPSDLGFYDLRVADNRIAQAELAENYGIYGFCYYHYWFNGKRLLEKPLDDVLATGNPDFPFMLCWANENWSRRWDGSDEIILIKQEYSEKDAFEHCKELLKYFRDPRYIRVDNKPVFGIYKTQIIPDAGKYIKALRNEAKKNGFELYIIRFEDHNPYDNNIHSYVDASVEFQPQSEILAKYWEDKKQHLQDLGPLNNLIGRIKNKFKSQTTLDDEKHAFTHHLDYRKYVEFLLKTYKYPSKYKRFPGVSPMWDNTARMGKKSFMLKNSTPELYEKWLKYHVQNFVPYSKDENFIFINAWNEWAEGNHLEPDQKWGLAYLESTKKALEAPNQ
jgi:lipopolysaccharide biosynthesis protein